MVTGSELPLEDAMRQRRLDALQVDRVYEY